MREAVVTGVGLVSPLGTRLEAAARCVAAGTAAPLRDGGMYVEEIPVDLVPPDKRTRLGRLDRLSRLFLSASYLAIQDAGLDTTALDAERFGLSLGTGLGCLLTDEQYYRRVLEKGLAAASPQLFAYTVSSAAAGEISIAMGIKGPNATCHMGLAAGAGAVGYAADWIRQGRADVVLAGGADALGPALVEALRDMDLLKDPAAARPHADAAPGICPSEAAVVFVLESAEHAREHGRRTRARVRGWAAGFEPTLTRPPRETQGIAAALRRALAKSGLAPADVGLILTSAHGTPIDAVEGDALHDVFPQVPPPTITPKAVHGECFGASGALAAALAIGLWEASGAAGSAALISAVCYSGNVVGLILSRE
jgi:3-oxoacyl-[acyl-carrier-protein] synthase II